MHEYMITAITALIKFLTLYNYHKVTYSFTKIHTHTKAHPLTPAPPQATIIN